MGGRERIAVRVPLFRLPDGPALAVPVSVAGGEVSHPWIVAIIVVGLFVVAPLVGILGAWIYDNSPCDEGAPWW